MAEASATRGPIGLSPWPALASQYKPSLSWVAREFFGINMRRVTVMRLAIIFFLGFDQLMANLDDGKFVSANSPVKNLLLAGGRIEVPRIPFVQKRNGSGPIFRADVKRSFAAWFGNQAMHLLEFPHEFRAIFVIFGGISRRNDLFRVRPKDL